MIFTTNIESKIARKREAYLESRSAQGRVADFNASAVKRGLLGDQRQPQPGSGSYRAGSALKALEYVLTLDSRNTRAVVLD